MEFTPYLNWIDSRQDELREVLHDWCLTNSGSYNLEGLDKMHNKMAQAFSSLGGQAESIELKPIRQLHDDGTLVEQPLGKALRIIKRPEAKKRVLLCGHMDTVFAVDHEFQKYQYLDDNTINGPGVADMKGGILVMLAALEAFERSPYAEKIGWEVLINSDEEIGSHGSASLLEESAKRNDIGMVYEPSMPDGTLAGARKGSGNFSLVVRGKAAHAGREHHLGRNAIIALSEAMIELDELNKHSENITVNVGRIVGGGAVNVVPDMAICHFNIRIMQQTEQQQAEDWVQKVVAKINKRTDYSAELHGGFTRPAKPFNKQQEKLFALLKSCGDDLGIKISHVATGGCCDGNNLLASGLPNIDTLGVRGGNIHSSDEYMLIDSLAERAKLSALLLMRFATED